MKTRFTTILLTIACTAGAAHAQQGTAPAATQASAAPAPQAAPSVGGIRFAFKGQSWDQILDYFSRVTGLPVVRETEVPKGSVDYISSQSYTLPEALSTLNQLLQTQNVMLRVEKDKLYLQKLGEMKRENIPTYVGALPVTVTDDTIVTLMLPLRHTKVGAISAQLGGLVGTYGSVTPIEQQNSLIIVETAGQVRRMLKLIDTLDQAEPDAEVRFFPLKYAKAPTLLVSLSSLVGQRQVEYVIGPDGKKTKIEESRMEGLSLTADERTNAIIGRGSRPKLNQLADVIELLDVPAAGGSASGAVAGAPAPVVRSVRTLMLRGALPSEAKKRLEELYADLPKDVKPTVLAMDEVGKLAIVGPSQRVAEGAALIEALDGERRIAAGIAKEEDDIDPQTVVMIPLRNADATAILPQVRNLQTPAQQKAVVVVAGPDGRSLVVSSLASEADQVRRIVEILDQAGRIERRTQVVKVQGALPAQVIAAARKMHESQRDPRNPDGGVEIDVATDGRTLTVTGTQAAIARFQECVRTAEQATVVQRDTRTFELKYALPSKVAPALTQMARQILAPKDGSQFVEPQIEALDPLRQVRVTGTDDQMKQVATLVETLDRAERTGRLVTVRQAKAADLAPQVRDLLAKTQVTDPAHPFVAPTIDVIEPTNALWVVGEPAQLASVEAIVRDLDTVTPSQLPPLRLLQVRAADAAQIAVLLGARYDQRPAELRREKPVRVEADTATNTLIVTAHEDVFPEIREFVEGVNRSGEKDGKRETVIIPIRAGRATEVAAALDKLYPVPPMPLDARGRPLPHLQKQKEIFVSADAATNTVIIEAPAERKAQFEALVAQLDRIELPPQAGVRTWRLDRGDPDKIAAAVRALAQGGALTQVGPGGRKSPDVTVSVEPASRTLIVTGDEAAFEKVDKVIADLQGVPQAGFKTYTLRSGRTEQVSTLLKQVLGARAKREFPGGESLVDVTSDRRTGTLIVSAPESLMTVADELVKQLDAAPAVPGSDTQQVRVHALTFAEANQLAPALQQSVAAMPSPATGDPMKVTIVPATGSNALILTGIAPDLDAVEKLIEPLDKNGAQDSAQVRTVTLKNARAETLAPLVEKLLSDRAMMSLRDMPQSLRAEYMRRGLDRAPVRVAADSRLNAVIVSGPQAVVEIAEQMIAQLDVAPTPAGGTQEVRVLTLRNADAAEISQTIGAMYANDPSGTPAPAVTVNAAANALVIRATAAQHAQIEAVSQKVDAAAAASGREMRTVALDPARGDAAELARMLERTLNRQGRGGAEVITVDELLKRAQKQGVDAPSAGDAGAQPVPATAPTTAPAPAAQPAPAAPAKPAGSALAPRRARTIATALAAAAFAQAPAAAAPVRTAAAPAPAASPSQGGLNQPADATELEDDAVTIAVDPATNSLVILGSKRAVERAQRIAQQAQQAIPSSGSALRVLQLPANVDAMQLRDVAMQTLLVLSPAGGRPGDLARRVAIVADPQGGTLVVAAPERDMEQVLDAVAKIVVGAKQGEPTNKPVLRTYSLTQSRAAKLAATLQQLFGSRRGMGPQGAPQFSSDERTNTLMVTALPAVQQEIDELVKRLDTAAPANDVQVKSFTLQHALADEVIWTLRQLLAQRGDAAPVRLDTDRTNNRVLVAGSPEQLATAESLLKELDKPAEIARVTEFVALKHAEPGKVREALQYFYGPDAVDAETPSRRAVRIVADTATNSLVISSPKEELEALRAMIAKLDSEDYDSSLQLRVFALHNAQSQSVAAAINTAFKGDAQERQQAAGVGPDGRPLRQAPTSLVKGANWVSAVADSVTNTVIVSASRQNLLKIEAIVKQLDGADVAELPAPRIIKVREGQSPTQLANALKSVFGADTAQKGVRAPRMVPDETSGTIIVRAEDRDWEQLSKLADELQAMRPEATGGLFMLELKHLSAEAAAQTVNGLGLTAAGATDPRGRVMRGAVKVFAVPGRNALAIAALPEDRAIVEDLVKGIDTEPTWAQAEGELVRLKHASAASVAASLQKMLDSAAAPGSNALAKALQEQVRRLRVKRPGVLTADVTLDLTKPIRLQADEKTNSILVSGAAENVEAAKELVTMLDDVPLTDAVTMRILPLENIEAAEFARVVRELFQQGKALGKVPGTALEGVPQGDVGKGLVDNVAITVIDRTNTVVVAGREESVALVEAMQQRLDSAKQMGTVEPHLITLKYADAKELAATLDAVLVQGQATPAVAGPMQKQVARLRMVAAQANGQPGFIESDVFAPMNRTLIRAEDGMNALIVVSTPANVEIVRELVRLLDVEAASPAASVRTYPLARAGATAVSQRLTQFFDQQAQAKAIRPEDKVRILPDERTNSLVVSTSGRSFAILEELLKQLDREVPADLRELKLIQLTHASATRLAPLVQQLMDSRLDRLKAAEPRAADLQKVTVLADERANTLLVSGSADAFDVIKGIVDQLDSLERTDIAPLHVLPMKRGNLERVASAVNQIMERRYADMPQTVSKRARPLVMTDPRSNCLLIAATQADFDDIKALVARIEEQPTDPAVALTVIPVQGVRVETIAPRLQTVMRERMQTLGETAKPSDRISIESDLATNTLIVAASPENVEIIKQLIDSLKSAGQDSVAGRDFEIVQLRKSRATDVVGLLDTMYVREENRRRGNDSVRAIADNRTNSVILSGAMADVTSLKKLVADLESAKPQEVVEIKYVPLKAANVLELISLIDSVLSGNSLGARGGQQATVVRYLKQIPGIDAEAAEMEINAAVRQSISLTPDIRSNTVIVRAPKEAMALVEKMIADLDRDDTSAQNVRVIRLAHAEAESVLEILNELFRLRRQGNLYVLKPRDSGAAGGTDGAAGGGATAPENAGRGTTIAGLELNTVPDAKQELAITIDPRTNSLLVSGTANYLNAVDKVVKELDTEQVGSREQHIYRLKNADATEVAGTLSKFADGERQRLLEAYGNNRQAVAGRLLDAQVTVVGDKKSNSVLLTGSPLYVEKLKGVLRELDVDPPQVLIQVMLAEVTLDNVEELGLEFARVKVGDGYYGAGGFGLNKAAFGPLQPKPPGLIGLAPALFSGLGVPNVAVGGPDFDLLINALAAQNRVQLLSNPSVMVANNTLGRIQVGQTIRVPDAVTVSAAGQQSAVRPEEVGVILEVTPSINPDGFVKINVEPEISRLSQQTTDISETFRSPIIERRRATTTVTVKDGETIVIGGLINDRYERTDRKIPLLGDIPIVGLAFRQKSEAMIKTELLIVLRPHVIRTPGAVKDATDDAINRLTLQPGLKEQIRKAELKGMQGRFNEKGELIDPIGAPSEPPAVDGDAPMDPLKGTTLDQPAPAPAPAPPAKPTP